MWTTQHHSMIELKPTSHRLFHRPKSTFCGKCGNQCQGNQECYAFNKICLRCGGHHHFKRMCKSKVIGQNNRQNRYDMSSITGGSFVQRSSGRFTKSFTSKQSHHYKPSLVQKHKCDRVHV